jgi:hypothetical protein
LDTLFGAASILLCSALLFSSPASAEEQRAPSTLGYEVLDAGRSSFTLGFGIFDNDKHLTVEGGHSWGGDSDWAVLAQAGISEVPSFPSAESRGSLGTALRVRQLLLRAGPLRILLALEAGVLLDVQPPLTDRQGPTIDVPNYVDRGTYVALRGEASGTIAFQPAAGIRLGVTGVLPGAVGVSGDQARWAQPGVLFGVEVAVGNAALGVRGGPIYRRTPDDAWYPHFQFRGPGPVSLQPDMQASFTYGF